MNLQKVNGLYILPIDLILEKERSVLLYPTFEKNKDAIDSFCYHWGTGMTKIGACNEVEGGISPSTINRILKYAEVGNDFCDEHGIDITKTDYKYIHRAALKIKKAQTKSTKGLHKTIKDMAEGGNFAAAKFLIQKVNPEEYGDQATQNQLDNLTPGNNSQTINFNILKIDDAGKKEIERTQKDMTDYIYKMRNIEIDKRKDL